MKYDFELECLVYLLPLIRRLYSISSMSNDLRDLLGISAYLFLNTCEYVKEVLSFHMNGSSNINLCLYTQMVDVKIGRNSMGARGNYLL